ncbi:hypothetical protein [Maricaulis sp.]|uniref:hypothetical protein n=1 Tax=Maricaulis sp. TaxID=1486257 RepID=UPI003A9389D3
MFVDEAVAVFDADASVRLIVEHECLHMLFGDSVLVRFKKSNSGGVGSNIPTQRVMDFIEPEARIPGLLTDIAKVELCYALDEFEANVTDVSVVARNRDRRLWAYSIAPVETGAVMPIAGRAARSPATADVLAFPKAAPRPQDDSDRPAVTPKVASNVKKNEEKDE